MNGGRKVNEHERGGRRPEWTMCVMGMGHLLLRNIGATTAATPTAHPRPHARS